jgi:signal transduction histidine kinase
MARSRELTAPRGAVDCPRVLRWGLLVGAVVLTGCTVSAGPPVLEVTEALRLEVADGGDAAGPPPDDAAFAGAPRVALPDAWSAARRARAAAAWYHAVVDVAAAPAVPWAVYLPRAVMSAGVWLNGVRMGESRGRNINRPLLVVLAPGVVHAGRNTVDIRLRVEPTYFGVLDDFEVGPEAALRRPFESRVFWGVTMVQVAVVLSLCLGGAGLVLGLRRQELVGFVESALACLLGAVAILDLVVAEPPLPAPAWQWIGISALAAAITTLVIGSHRFLALDRPRLERGVLIVWLAGAGSLAIALALGSPQLTQAVVAVWVGWRATVRLIEALDESATLNRNLERRVAERGEEIARGYDRIRGLERDRAVQGERERLMRDIHDGFGGQLTSTLALVEQTDVAREEIGEALRDALDDMRLVVSSVAPVDADLIALLASWRARIERRLERHGLRFEWLVRDLPPLAWLGPREALHVLRIFQEAVSNVVQHAGATTITVRTGARPAPDGREGVFVEIGDDGCGLGSAAGADGSGVGLPNIARRAAELGGSVAVDGGRTGTLVVLWLPIEGPEHGH